MPNFDDKETAVRAALNQLSPDQQAIAKTLTTLKIENQVMKRNLAKLQDSYDSIYRVMLVVLDACDERELRIHRSQFLRFKEEYRIDQSIDDETDEFVLRLLTLKD